jgi:cytochrome P450
MRALADIDPFDPEVVQQPHEFFAALRREAPLYRLPNGAYYLISRYRDVRAAALNPEVFSSSLIAVMMQGQDQPEAPQLLTLPEGGVGQVDALAIADPPAHTRQRKLSNKAFSVRRVVSLEPAIRALAESLVGAILPTGGARRSSADWVREVAVPLPMTVIAGLIGLPNEDVPQLKRWSDSAIAILAGTNTPAQLAHHAAQVSQLVGYFVRHFDEAARAPQDDVLGDLVRATQGSEALTRDEVISILLQILTAGNETTTSLIGSALLLLLENPDLEARVRADGSLLEPLIEEVLRLESPLHGHFRVVRRDTEVAGTPLPEGSRVMLLWGAANRDGDEFPNPDAIDLARPNAKAHLGFGIGIHHCIGASLARLEARVVFETLFGRTRAIRRAEQKVAYAPSLLARSLASLPVELAI